MKIKELLKIRQKKTNDFENNNLALIILLSHTLGKNKEYLFSHPEENVNFWHSFLFKRMVKKYLRGYSPAVLTGHKWFYGLDFFVNKNVLVPRPETELIIDEIKNYELPVANIIDIGTGSGCIIITLAKILNNKNINFYGLDISKKALKVAKKNAKKHGVDSCINFLHSDLLNIIDFKKMSGPIFITANLPYLTPKQIKNSPSIQKEPRIALESGLDGLNHYRKLFKQIKHKLKNWIPAGVYPVLRHGTGMTLFCEIDESQSESFSKLVKQEFPSANFILKKDLNNFDRLAIINFDQTKNNDKN